MSDTTTLIQRLSDEADLCRNDGATDIAGLLDEAQAALEQQAAQIAMLEQRATCGCGDQFTAHDPGTCGNCCAAADRSNEIEALRADAERQATPDQILELCEALETRRILNEIKKVATLHPADDMPTPFQSAWQTCCEEIFYRATGEQWHMDEDARKFARAANDSDIDAALRQEQPNE